MRCNPAASAWEVTRSSTWRMDGGVGDQPVFADLVAAGFELRLDQRDDVGAGRQQWRQRRAECAAAR